MESLELNKAVEKVVIVEEGRDGEPVAVVVYQRKGKKKKGTPGLRTIEKGVQRAVDAQRTFTDAYEAGHQQSNEKRDGWLRDLPKNLSKAGRKAAKKLLKRI